MDVIFSHRFRAFLDYLRSEGRIYNDADFCRKINKKPSLISDFVRGKRTITSSFAEYVASWFPELNPCWLYERECTSMLVDDGSSESVAPKAENVPDVSEPSSGSQDIVRLHKIIEKQQATIDRLLQIIERMQDGNGED